MRRCLTYWLVGKFVVALDVGDEVERRVPDEESRGVRTGSPA